MDFKNFSTHRSADASDPGFSIQGVKMRWISGRVRERSDSSGIWVPFKKSALPKELVEHILKHYPNAFSEGDTIRRGSGELILAYATKDHADAHRARLDLASKSQASTTKVMPKQDYIGKKDFTKITAYEETSSTVPDHFLSKKE